MDAYVTRLPRPASLVVMLAFAIAAIALAMVLGLSGLLALVPMIFGPAVFFGTVLEFKSTDELLGFDAGTLRGLEDHKTYRRLLSEAIERMNAEHDGKAFPEEIRSSFVKLTKNLEIVDATISELEKRTAIVSKAAERTAAAEDEERQQRVAPGQINRKSTDEIWSLRNITDNWEDPAAGNAALKERALRAIDASSFPRGVDKAHALEHLRGLLERSYDDKNPSAGSNEIARRIITTGSPAYHSAFRKTLGAMLRGQPVVDLTAEEQRAMSVARAMSVGTGSAGGFAVVFQLDPTLIPTSSLSVNPFRAISNVSTIAGTNEWRGVTQGGITAGYGTEATEASDNSPTLAQPTLTTVRAFAFVPVSIELTQDWGEIQSELAQAIQDGKDDLEASKFTSGSGTNEPFGVLTGATNTTTAGGVAAFAVADLYKVWEALPPRFRPRASWVANLFTYDKVRQFDTNGGAAMWAGYPNPLQVGTVSQAPRNTSPILPLLGRPAYEDSSMVSALTTGNKILLVGDFRYYKIVDRIGMDIEVIPHLFGAANRFPTGQRGFYAFWRNTAKVLSANAFQVLVTG